MRVLHVAAELFPYVKVGGLGDVLSSLPPALRRLGLDVRVLLPAYPSLVQALPRGREVAAFPDLMGSGSARVFESRTPEGVPLYLLESPFFDRPGNPYEERGDSHLRFAAFSWVAAALARQGDGQGWCPQVLHLHDWQVALAPAFLEAHGGPRPATVITVHNLAYQGIYDASLLDAMWLPRGLFHMHGVEYHGRISFLKAGLQLSDRITTVSPTYAREIQTPAFGEGLDPLLAYRARDVRGILNGIDEGVWHPARDPHLAVHYGAARPSGKRICKNLLQREAGLDEAPDRPLFSVVSRFAPQKGLDLVLENVNHLLGRGAQLLVLGSGDPALEAGFQAASERHPGALALRIGFDEGFSHRVMAGSDALLVPSRFEPCGLTQMYAMAYGALPVVRWTGGLADTVTDACQGEEATGFVFREPTGLALGHCLDRALDLWAADPKRWQAMARRGMKRDQGWQQSARAYEVLYLELAGAPARD